MDKNNSARIRSGVGPRVGIRGMDAVVEVVAPGRFLGNQICRRTAFHEPKAPNLDQKQNKIN